jgi:predicted CopG family antitoxin
MAESQLLSDLGTILSIESRSMLRYIVEVSTPCAVDAMDREILGDFAAFHEEERRFEEEIVDLIFLLGGEPGPRIHNLSAPHYNFLTPRYLVSRYVEMAAAEVKAYEEMLARHRGDAAVAGLVLRLIEAKRRHIDVLRRRAEKIEAEQQKVLAAAPKPAVKAGPHAAR